ncbi:MAG: GNAT family N-acetyltransferase [Rhodobacteraceae bacterium]|nr:GNAT family N-acetyltransferase [Paracoccaceae bacterium]
MIVKSMLKTERLTLRPFSDADAPLITLYLGNWRVSKNLDRAPYPYPEGAAESFIDSTRRPDFKDHIWAIDKDGQLIGAIAIGVDEKNVGNVGFWLAPQLWGGGFMPEALFAIIEFAKNAGFSKLDASVHQGNDGSVKVLMKCGFSYVGDVECTSVARGATIAAWEYELLL